jgi:hypothetical protein
VAGRVSWLLGLLLATLLLAPPAVAQGGATLDGTIVQGTAGGGSVAGLPVRLLVFQGHDKVDEREATTDAAGHFRFDQLDPAPERIYFPVIEYQQVSYYPDPVSFKDATSQAVQITVYEPTPGDGQVAYQRANLVLTEVAPDRLYVMEMGTIANQGDRTFAAAETLRFPLPQGAEAFSPRYGLIAGSVSQRPGGFVLTGPVLPGPHELAYSYELPVQDQRAELTRTLQYPVQSFNLYVPLQGVQVDSPQLADAGQRDMGGQTYRVLSAGDLPRGSVVQIRLSGLPELPGASAQRLGYLLLVVGAAVVLAALGLAWRRMTATPRPASAAAGVDALEARREQLLATLADLDERYEAGELDATGYRRQRDLHKRRLVALMRAPGGASRGQVPSPESGDNVPPVEEETAHQVLEATRPQADC